MKLDLASDLVADRMRGEFRACLILWFLFSLARIMHEFSAAGPGSSALTALPTLGLLDRVHDYDCGALGHSADWNQWRGPGRDGLILQETLESWPDQLVEL